MKKIMFNDRFGLTEAVLSGRKTQTRRIVPKSIFQSEYDIDDNKHKIWIEDMYGDWHDVRKSKYCFKVGEIVAVAQSYYDAGFGDNTPIIGVDENSMPIFASEAGIFNKMFVRADLMPHQIRITKVRVERLQDISDEDCTKEGIVKRYDCGGIPYYKLNPNDGTVIYRTPQEAYAALIDHISGKGTWNSNPYVFVYEFELVK